MPPLRQVSLHYLSIAGHLSKRPPLGIIISRGHGSTWRVSFHRRRWGKRICHSTFTSQPVLLWTHMIVQTCSFWNTLLLVDLRSPVLATYRFRVLSGFVRHKHALYPYSRESRAPWAPQIEADAKLGTTHAAAVGKLLHPTSADNNLHRSLRIPRPPSAVCNKLRLTALPTYTYYIDTYRGRRQKHSILLFIVSYHTRRRHQSYTQNKNEAREVGK